MYAIEKNQDLSQYSAGFRKMVEKAADARKEIFLWQTMQMLELYDVESVQNNMGCFLVDLEGNTTYPVIIGDAFPSDTWQIPSFDFDDSIQKMCRRVAPKHKTDFANLLNRENMRANFENKSYYQGAEYLTQREGGYKWLFIAYHLNMNEDDGHLYAYLVMFQNDEYHNRQEHLLSMA